MHHLKLLKFWRRPTVVAIPKLMKPLEGPRSYRLILLLCTPFKILERLIYTRVQSIRNPQLLGEQAVFPREKSTVDQVTLLTQSIKDSFSNKKRLVLCLLTSQQPTILYGTAASPASFCVFCRTAHGLPDHETCSKSQFYSYHWY